MSEATQIEWNDYDQAVIEHDNRDAILSGALKIARELPKQRVLADETLAFVKELLDWRDGRRLPWPTAAEGRTEAE